VLLRWRFALGVALLSLAACWGLAWVAARALVVSEPLGRADALVVLAGSSAYGERARHAARLFGEGRAPLVILTNDGGRSGWSNEQGRNPLFVERAAEELRRAGVPAAQIEVLPGEVASTYEEAALIGEHARRKGLRSLLLVTSGYHSRRALWTARRLLGRGGVAVGLEAVEPGAETPAPSVWWLYPSGWRVVAGEYLKFAYYALRY
jgi:uncharacterized SAM-binding protein YcdF (DUF218 family)